MQLTATHYISLAVTLLVTLLPGLLAARRVKSADDYNVGGRSSGAGLVAGTIIGTIVGGAATVGTAQLTDHRSGVSRYGLWQACGVAGDLQRLRRYFFQHRSEHADGVASHCRLVRRTAFGCSGHCYRCYFAAGVFRWPQQQRNGRDF